ncbi:MAG TPA: hypothetical protein VG759_19140 [Candidatus Angelobacter sp.]|jgi:hypothetical protein|nr:hypothetical protein [Candidatus Angelobacter sp.]
MGVSKTSRSRKVLKYLLKCLLKCLKAAKSDQFRNPRRTAIIFGPICIVVLYVNAFFLTRCSFHIHGGMLVLCSIIGGLAGWTFAVLATPASGEERLQFNSYAKVVSGFLSGFLFTKFSNVISDTGLKNFLKQSDHLVQFGYGSGYTFAFFLIGLMWTFLVRRYTPAKGDGQQGSKPEKTDEPGGAAKPVEATLSPAKTEKTGK